MTTVEIKDKNTTGIWEHGSLDTVVDAFKAALINIFILTMGKNDHV